MKRTARHLLARLGALALLGAGAAGAQTPAKPPAVDVPPPTEPRAPKARTRLSSSHTVELISPEQKVDTILGRMRPERPPPPSRPPE